MILSWIPLFAIWAVTRYSSGVRIKDLDVPSVALEGDEVHLRCDYEDEGGSSLYTLKWYKDGKEFYRHQPGISPYSDKCADHNTYDVVGVQVECWTSTERDVVLKSVSKDTSGDYRCEVIGEHPKFRKEIRSARLTVFSEELQPPRVTGNEESYRTFDLVSLNCSSTNKEYTPDIAWKVNGHRASSNYVLKYEDRRSVGLHFRAVDDLFRRGVIEVTCVTSMGAYHTRSRKVHLTNRDYLSAQGYYYNSGLKRGSVSLGAAFSCFLFSVAVLLPAV
ncbi:uncharacterized protein [Macrobrachium rosenbergii]|uniref:uncharacterized protein isoform X1 n=1 Tax=Macrobrachium rosenbergii TaxID=79674 RepID=UPI0034D44D16